MLSGYASLKWSDYRANPEHPPLAKLWAALPLLAMDIKDPRPAAIAWEIIPLTPPHTTHTGSVAAKLFFVDNDGETLFFWAKLQFLLLALLLGGFIYRWSKELFGFEAALASLFLYGLDPNILAHSQIVHTDIAFTGVIFYRQLFFLARIGETHMVESRAYGVLLRFGGSHEIRLSCHARSLGRTGPCPYALCSAPGMRLGQASLRGWPAAESCALVRHLFLLAHRRLLHDLGSLRISL